MALATQLFGVTYQIPETKERPWGATVTALLRTLTIALNALAASPSGQPLLAFASASTVLTAGGTLSPTNIWHRISGSGAPVVLNTITAISDGLTDGQLLLLTGSDASNIVTIQNSANTQMNGHAALGLNEALLLIWNAAISDWSEIVRTS